MPEILKVIILGIVEGITEWLPVSSTGHMLLLYELFSINEQEPFWALFLTVIQFGAILAVILMYFKILWPFKMPDSDLAGRDKALSIFKEDKIIMWLKIMVSCIPAVIVGLTIDDWIEAHLYNYIVVAVMLILYGILFILVENYNADRTPTTKKISMITWKHAILIGVFQALAIIPGTSRSGATILGGILLGLSRKCASEYTFFLAIPTMFGASVLKIVKFMKDGATMTGQHGIYIIVGMTIAFAVSMFAIRFMLRYIRKHDFKLFGRYRIVLGVIVLLYFAVKSIFI